MRLFLAILQISLVVIAASALEWAWWRSRISPKEPPAPELGYRFESWLAEPMTSDQLGKIIGHLTGLLGPFVELEERYEDWRETFKAATPEWLDMALEMLVAPENQNGFQWDIAQFLSVWAYKEPEMVLPCVAALLDDEKTRLLALQIFRDTHCHWDIFEIPYSSNIDPAMAVLDAMILRHLGPWCERAEALTEEEAVLLVEAIASCGNHYKTDILDVPRQRAVKNRLDRLQETIPSDFTRARAKLAEFLAGREWP